MQKYYCNNCGRVSNEDGVCCGMRRWLMIETPSGKPVYLKDGRNVLNMLSDLIGEKRRIFEARHAFSRGLTLQKNPIAN